MSALSAANILEEFKGLNPNDVATWPLIPRLVALVVIFVLVFVIGYFAVLGPELEELDLKKQGLEKLKQEFLEKKRQSINLDLYTQQLNEIDQTFGALLKQLPNKSEMEALLVEINQSGLGRGLQFEYFRPGQEISKDFYAELPISIKIVGGYHDIGQFAADIARLPRIVTLNNLSLMPVAGKMSLEATTKTFRYLDEEEVARLKRAAKEAKEAKERGKK